MKKIIFFSLFSCSLLLLIPFVSSVESTLIRDEIKEKFVFNQSIFENINIKIINILLNIIKMFIFFELGFSFYFLIYSIMEQYPIHPGNLFQLIYGFLWTGFMVFINCFYELIYQLLSLNIDLFIFYLSIFLFGFFIFSLVGINPNISNYLIGSFVYGLFIFLHIFYISKYFDFEPHYEE